MILTLFSIDVPSPRILHLRLDLRILFADQRKAGMTAYAGLLVQSDADLPIDTGFGKDTP